MPRTFDARQFDRVYHSAIVRGRFQEEPAYYPRYRSRYKYLVSRFARLADAGPCDVLDIGGGQHALLCKLLWNDRATVADFDGPHLAHLRDQGVGTTTWDLCGDAQPFTRAFDAIFFSEVIEHLPIPSHIVLERLRLALRPGGWLICSTPNLYRLRNIVYLLLGMRIFDYFRMPQDRGLGHVLEFSRDHLEWQLSRAGFVDRDVELRELRHAPNNPVFRLLSWLGAPLLMVPRFRGNLIATARAPL